MSSRGEFIRSFFYDWIVADKMALLKLCYKQGTPIGVLMYDKK
jgi:hypothetical protein